MSSILTSHSPCERRACRKLATAAVREPTCRGPVGEGANRPTYGTGPPLQRLGLVRVMKRLAIVVLAVTELFFCTLAAFLSFHTERRDRPSLQATKPDLLAGLLAIAVGLALHAL